MSAHSPVLILFAHPAFQESRVNRVLVDAIQDIDGITFHDLYEAYPDFHIDVVLEQRLLDTHDSVVFHHPFYWYSMPALLKEWQDLVLQHGWAYGHEGEALHGKRLISAITTGGPESAYRQEGTNHCTVGDLLLPFSRTAELCGMTYLPPFVIHGTHNMAESDIASHADDYRRTLIALRDGHIDPSGLRDCGRLNADLDAIITQS